MAINANYLDSQVWSILDGSCLIGIIVNNYVVKKNRCLPTYLIDNEPNWTGQKNKYKCEAHSCGEINESFRGSNATCQ
ncbi:unnamed protein product [Tenebrio molitor]|nr:unnamed protein product [Tenebrio molitor]